MPIPTRPFATFALAFLAFATGCLASEPKSPGVTGEAVVFGQSGCFSGACRRAGLHYRAGILAAFHERNRSGGINGRTLRLVARDDRYQASAAAANAMKFVSDNNVFAIIGGVGSPTARRMAPILRSADVPFVGILSGADFLRDRARFPNVINLRTGYFEETRQLVTYLYNKMGARRFGIIYQEDSFGRSVLDSYHDVLKTFGLPILAKANYSWHAHSVHGSVFLMEKADLDVVLLATTTATAADAINLARSLGHRYVVGILSVVSVDQLRRLLDYRFEPAVISRITPDVRNEKVALVKRFRAALEDYRKSSPDASELAASSFGIEGYIVGRFVIDVLERIPEEPTRKAFLEAALAADPFVIDDWVISFTAGSNAGTKYVRLIEVAGDSSEKVTTE